MEAARVIGEWRKASTVEDANANNVNNRITIRNIFGLVGNGIGEQALTMFKAKEDERLAAVAADSAKKEQTREKKARDTIALVTTGYEILKRLE